MNAHPEQPTTPSGPGHPTDVDVMGGPDRRHTEIMGDLDRTQTDVMDGATARRTSEPPTR